MIDLIKKLVTEDYFVDWIKEGGRCITYTKSYKYR